MSKKLNLLAWAIIFAVSVLVICAALALWYLAAPAPQGMGHPGLSLSILTTVFLIGVFVKWWRSL